MDKIQFIGRWYSGSDGISKTSYGHSFVVRFKGSSHVGVTLKTGPQVETGEVYYFASIDGGEPTRLKHSGTKSTLKIPFQLDASKEHTLMLSRSSEAAYGETTLYDIVLDRGYEALVATALSGLRYEAIGDSITAGWNDLLPAGTEHDGGSKGEDLFSTYEYRLAQAWNLSDWRAVARSGIGAISVDGALPMHDEYLCSTFHDGSGCSRPWDFSSWQADVVTVNLGTNDYSAMKKEPSKENFVSAYTLLLKTIRQKYPSATIFAIRPLQYSCPDYAAYSSNPEKWERMSTYMQDIVAGMDTKVHFIETGTKSDLWLDCDKDYVDGTHPTVAGHQKFAKQLEKVLTPLLPDTRMIV